METCKIKFRFIRLRDTMLLLFIATLLFSCKNDKENAQDDLDTQQVMTDTVTTPVEVRAYTGKISPLKNSDEDISGEIAVRVEGDLARFHITAEGLAPDMMHMQYLLVSQSGSRTQCPDDVEGMSVIQNNTIQNQSNTNTTEQDDLRRIPLHTGIATMDLNIDTYPRTNENGELEFTQTVHLDSLGTAINAQYIMQDLDFSNATIVIRGVPDEEPNQPNQPGQNRGVSGTENITAGCARLQETAVRD